MAPKAKHAPAPAPSESGSSEVKRRRTVGKTTPVVAAEVSVPKLPEAAAADADADGQSSGANVPAPAHWPAGVAVYTKRRINWLPMNWGQGIKTTANGKPLTTFISPEGKMFYHRATIEQTLGRKLEPIEDTIEYDGAGTKICALIPQFIERPAHWPDSITVDTAKWVSWVPEGWGQGLKTTGGGKTCKVYISPEGKMLYHRVDVEKAIGRPLTSKDEAAERASVAATVATPQQKRDKPAAKATSVVQEAAKSIAVDVASTPVVAGGFSFEQFRLGAPEAAKSDSAAPLAKVSSPPVASAATTPPPKTVLEPVAMPAKISTIVAAGSFLQKLDSLDMLAFPKKRMVDMVA